MIKDGKILLGKADDKEIYLIPRQMNRHGLIAGASGTGKTVTLKVIAESLAELGVPTVIADVKGDLSGMIIEGSQEGIQGRLDSMEITDFFVRRYPVHFFDVYGKKGHPIRVRLQEMGPMLLSRIMDLTDAQMGALNIIFRVAEDMELDIIDLKDLQAMAAYVGEHSKEYTVKYGNVSKQSIGAIQRKLLTLETEGAEQFFGMPSLNIEDWLMREGGTGIMNIIECAELFRHPALYATFLYWMLNELYSRLPEVGDLSQPKIVFFFDEAHILFDGASKQLLEKIEQTVKLIRSKGVGVFFITQTPNDIPNSVLGQLSNRIQHSLRAYTPAEIKATKLAAQSFRENPAFDTAEMITNMKTGQALVSVLDEDGAPTIVEKTKILPPKSSMNIADDAAVENCIKYDNIYGKYEKAYDPESAYEAMDDIYRKEEEVKLAEEEAARKEKEEERKAREEAKLAAKMEAQAAKEAARKEKEKTEWADKLARKAQNRLENEALNLGIRQAKKFLKNFLK